MLERHSLGGIDGARGLTASVDIAPPRKHRPPSRRLVGVFICLSLGCVLGRDALAEAPPAWLLSAAFALTVLGAVLRGWACRVSLALAVILLGASWFGLRIYHEPADGLARTAQLSTDEHPVLISAVGIVTSRPELGEPPRGMLGPSIALERNASSLCRFTLRVFRVEPSDDAAAPPLPASGTLRVRVSLDELDAADDASPPAAVLDPMQLKPGNCIRITGRLSPIAQAMNPGEPDWDLIAAQNGVAGALDVPTASLIEPRTPGALAEHAAAVWHGFRGALHARARHALGIDAPPPSRERAEGRSLIAALLLGETDHRLRELSSTFRRLGILHMVAISGFNLAVMAGCAMFALRLAGDRGWLEPVVIAALVVGYLLILPGDSPILRAGLLVLVLLVSEAAGRRYDRVSLLALVGMALVLYKPMDVFNLGFQLSFGVVAALLLLGDRMNERLFGMPLRGVLRPHKPPGKPAPLAWAPDAWRGVVTFTKANISAGILAYLVSTPLIAAHTGLVAPLAIITGLVLLPITVVVLWTGYAALLVGVIIPSASTLSTGVLDALGVGLAWIVRGFDGRWSAPVHLPKVSMFLAAIAVAWIVWCVVRPPARRWFVTSLLALVAWTSVETLVLPSIAADVPLRVDTLAVGEGACRLVRSGGESMLIDAGSTRSGLGENVIPQALRELGASRVRTVIITTPTLGSYSALIDLVEPLGIRRVYIPPSLQTVAANVPYGHAAELLRGLESAGVEVIATADAQQIALGHATINVVLPSPEAAPKSAAQAGIALVIAVPTHTGPRSALVLSAARDLKLPVAEPSIVLATSTALAAHPTRAHAAAFVALSTDELGSRETSNTLSTANNGCISVTIGTDGRCTARVFAPHASPSSR